MRGRSRSLDLGRVDPPSGEYPSDGIADLVVGGARSRGDANAHRTFRFQPTMFRRFLHVCADWPISDALRCGIDRVRVLDVVRRYPLGAERRQRHRITRVIATDDE